jgi:YD repeat-containing protein
MRGKGWATRQLASVTYGSGDSDSYQYDPNTGRMTQYQFAINGSNLTGALTWNANGTLQQLAITDPFNSADGQTCAYQYDPIARLTSVNCGNAWSQTFSYDFAGNLKKSGSLSRVAHSSPILA